jgi:antitoxin component of MazEF toxin-antitoxin module
MTVTVKKIGGSVGVLIPKALADDLALVAGTTLEITSDEGSLLMRKKARRSRRSMAKLVAQMKSAEFKKAVQEHRALVNDPPVGKEFW